MPTDAKILKFRKEVGEKVTPDQAEAFSNLPNDRKVAAVARLTSDKDPACLDMGMWIAEKTKAPQAQEFNKKSDNEKESVLDLLTKSFDPEKLIAAKYIAEKFQHADAAIFNSKSDSDKCAATDRLADNTDPEKLSAGFKIAKKLEPNDAALINNATDEQLGEGIEKLKQGMGPKKPRGAAAKAAFKNHSRTIYGFVAGGAIFSVGTFGLTSCTGCGANNDTPEPEMITVNGVKEVPRDVGPEYGFVMMQRDKEGEPRFNAPGLYMQSLHENDNTVPNLMLLRKNMVFEGNRLRFEDAENEDFINGIMFSISAEDSKADFQVDDLERAIEFALEDMQTEAIRSTSNPISYRIDIVDGKTIVERDILRAEGHKLDAVIYNKAVTTEGPQGLEGP